MSIYPLTWEMSLSIYYESIIFSFHDVELSRYHATPR